MSTNHPDYEAARRHVTRLRGFYWHLTSYVVVILALTAVNALTSPHYWWVVWAAIGWGIGLCFHGAPLFRFRNWLGKEWEERKIREILDKGDRG